MKIFALLLIAFIIPFQASASENNGLTTTYPMQQTVMESSPDKNRGNLHQAAWLPTAPTGEGKGQVKAEKQESFLSALCIYTLIILVYSIYWHKNNKTIE